MSTYAIRRRGLQGEIQEIVKRYIIDHGFKPGDALPGEGELAKQMGISRPSLREAIKVLQTIGIIETRHGAGTFVGNLSLDPIADGTAFQILLATNESDSPPQELLDFIEMREAVEVQQTRKVAGMHSAAQIERMRALNDEILASRASGPLAGERDLALHQLFYQPLASQIAGESVRLFWKVCNLSILPEAFMAEPERLNDHGPIIDALESSDADEAAAAMSAHVQALAHAAKNHHDPVKLREQILRTQITS